MNLSDLEFLIKKVENDLRWDDGKLGRDIEHVKPAKLTPEEYEKIKVDKES